MSEEVKIRCESCGAIYSVGTRTCRSCGQTLRSIKQQKEDETLEGMPLKDWRAFIGKRSDDYIKIFKKNENKRIFFSFNIFALVFGPYWMIYRKMYKYALIYYVLIAVISTCFLLIGMAINTPEIKEARRQFEPYTQYMTFSGNTTTDFPPDREMQMEIYEAYDNYEDAIEDIAFKCALFARLGNIVILLVAPLLGNCVYREYILNHTARRKGYVANSGKGGVSLVSSIVVFFFGESVLSGLLLLISTIALFFLTGL